MTRALVIFLCLVAACSVVFADCSTTTVNCFSRVATASETCVSSPADCPKRAACTTSAAPYRCADDTCQATPQACVTRLRSQGIVCAVEQTCWDGSCVSDRTLCPFIPPCPSAFDYRCVDMTCRQDCAGVPPKSQVFSENAASGVFCPNVPGYLCYENAGCFMGDLQCPDGSCAVNRSFCLSGPSDNAGGGKNWAGCNGTTQVRCFGARYGTCNDSVAACPAVPARQYVMPFAGTVGPLAANFSLVAEQQGGAVLGFVAVPRFLSETSAPLNLIVNSQFRGDLLYPFDSVTNPELGIKIVGMGEETENKFTFWRTDVTKPPVDSPVQSILSPIIKMYSPQLRQILLTQAANLSAAMRAEATKLLQQNWVVNVTMYAYPPKIGCRAPICLAQVGEKGNSSVPVWQCVDSNPVELAPNLWSAKTLVQDLAFQTHFAFIADYRRSRCTFPRLETVGGGMLALGVIAFVVFGIIVLANREKLANWVTASVFKTSG